jgi:hypothetical protein
MRKMIRVAQARSIGRATDRVDRIVLEEEEFVHRLRPGLFPAHDFFLLREGVGEGNRP